jgi:prepilin-type N-terminal cleavage/methylation domain-containing protein
MPRNQKGFTLIELLIVVVIIGILAAIAIPKFANTKEKAYVASMKSDLRNLITAQEAYFSDNNSSYAQGTANLGTNYKASSGITVTISGTTNTGCKATATSVSTNKTCTITLGNGSTDEGDPVCQ